MIERSTEVNIGGEVIGIVGWVIKETELLAPKGIYWLQSIISELIISKYIEYNINI